MSDVNLPSAYQEEVAQYAKKDAIHALLFFVIMRLFSIFPFLPTGQIPNLVFSIVMLVALFVFIKIKGQGLRSIGLHLKDWKKSLAVGLFFAVVLLMLLDGLLPGLIGGWQMQPAGMVAWLAIITLVQAFYEDVFYVGYIQTRIYGLIKNDKLAVFVGAVLFAALHYIYFFRTAIASGEGLGLDVLGSFVAFNIWWIVFHVMMNIIFRNMRSIIPVTLFHFVWNFAIFGHFWESGYENGLSVPISMVIAFGAVFLVVWWVLPLLKKRKVAK